MTNAEKYKTAEERQRQFNKFCSNRISCASKNKTQQCKILEKRLKSKIMCSFLWLELEAEETK